MSTEPPRVRRRHSRFLIDLPLTLWDSHHRLIDSGASAHDVTPDGFGFESRADIKHRILVYFELRLPDSGSVSGAARLAWHRQTEQGGWAGAKIVDISRADRRRIIEIIHGPSYNWSGLATRGLIALALVAGGFGAQSLLDHGGDLLPASPWLAVAAAAAVAAVFNSVVPED